MLDQIVKSMRVDIPLYSFYKNENDQVVYKCVDESFTLTLSQAIGHALGFSYETILGGGKLHVAKHKRRHNVSLSKEDYHLRYFNSNVLRKVTRVVLEKIAFENIKLPMIKRRLSFNCGSMQYYLLLMPFESLVDAQSTTSLRDSKLLLGSSGSTFAMVLGTSLISYRL